MEFNEKLQELRKSRGLTQEELAEELYVSRTAISKWESGRGSPSIESLKQIANYFSVTIDDLLSGEKLLSIAEKENKSNIQNLCNMLFGIVDICSIMLIVLPLYPNKVNEFIYSVNLFSYIEISSWHKMIYWILFILMILVGLLKVMKIKHKMITSISIILSIVTVLFLSLSKEAYAVTVVFMLFVIKGILLLKYLNK